MSLLVLLLRFGLAATFAISGITKLRSRPAAREAVRAFGVPSPFVRPVAISLPFVELAAATLLLPGGAVSWLGALLSLCMLVAFTAGVALSLSRGRHPDCACFGALSTKPVGWRTVARNSALMAAAGGVLAGGPRVATTSALIRAASAEQIVVTTTLILLVLAVTALGLFSRALLAQQGRLMLRLEGLEALARGEVPSVAAPEFQLLDVGCQAMSLASLLDEGRPVLLVFTSSDCSACSEFAPEIPLISTAHPGLAVVVVLRAGQQEATEAYGGHGFTVLLDDDGTATSAYGVDATPAAVLVSESGLVESHTAYGGDAIRALAAEAAAAFPAVGGPHLPPIALSSDAGERIVPSEIPGPVVLLFWDVDCRFCQHGLPAVRQALEASPARRFVVTDSEPVLVAAQALPAAVLQDPDRQLMAAAGAPGTPSAVALHDGRMIAPVAVGAEEVVALLLRTRSRETVTD